MFISASRATPRSRLCRSNALFPPTPLKSSQQYRNFRLGPWCFPGNDDNRKHPQTHNSGVRYRYMESISKGVPWNPRFQGLLHKAITDVTRTLTEPHRGNKFADIDSSSWYNNPLGVRPGRSIEDVEREAINHLFRRTEDVHRFHGIFSNIREHLSSSFSYKFTIHKNKSNAATSGESECGDIDPITNRRVPKKIPQSYTPKFEDVDMHPRHTLEKYGPMEWKEPNGLAETTEEEDSKRYADLDKYKPHVDDPNLSPKSTSEQLSKKYDLHEYRPVKWNEPDGFPEVNSEERSKKYNDLHTYKPSVWNEPHGLPKKTPEEVLKQYKDLGNYVPVEWNEPDGLPKPTLEEKSKDYDDLNKYGPVQWHEPDGLPNLTREELSKRYPDLGEYNTVRWSEPDGLRQLTPEELSKEYTDLKKYDGPRVVDDSVLDAHQAKQMDLPPRGRPLPQKVNVTAEDPRKEYKDLDKYGPIRWNEPDGLPKPTAEEVSKQYQDLNSYRNPLTWNEPDGLPNPTSEESSRVYADVQMYATNAQTEPEIASACHPEELSKDYKDLGSYGPVIWNEPNGQRKQTPEEVSKKYGDLGKYRQVNLDNSQGQRHSKESSRVYKDLDKYAQYPDHNSPSRVHPEELSKNYDDLDKYDPQSFDSPLVSYHSTLHKAPKASKDPDHYFAIKQKGKIRNRESVHPKELTKAYADLDRYDPQQFDSPSNTYGVSPDMASGKYKELDQYASGRTSEPDESSAESEGIIKDNASHYGTTCPELAGTFPTGRQGQANSPESSIDPIDRLTAQGIRADVLHKVQPSNQKGKLENLKAEHERSWDVAAKNAQDALQKIKVNLNQTSNDNQPETTTGKMDQCFMNSNKQQDILVDDGVSGKNGQQESGTTDVEYSSMDESFPTKGSNSEPIPDQQKDISRIQEPMAYKILAYDTVTGTIRVAETSSSMLDKPPCMTPAEVMPLLENPAKFLPHFSSLHAQGYEIVSGKGNVVVFHKVREASPDLKAVNETNDTEPVFKRRINPIDMMGAVTSPTGFVNYDGPVAQADKSAPPPDPIDDSCQNATGDDGFKSQSFKKRRIVRKMGFGLALVAGSAYAAGMIGESFARDPQHSDAVNREPRRRP